MLCMYVQYRETFIKNHMYSTGINTVACMYVCGTVYNCNCKALYSTSPGLALFVTAKLYR